MEKLRTMNPEQVAMLLRTAGQSLGGWAVGHSYVTQSGWEFWSGLIIALALTAWGYWARKDTNLLASAAAVPGTKAVVVEQSIASAVPDPKVTSAASARGLLSLGFLLLLVPMLGGCVTSGVTPAGAATSEVTVLNPAPVEVAPAATTVGKVQQAAITTCKFVPTVNTAAAVVASFTDYGDEVGMARRAAAAICASLHEAGYVSLKAKQKTYQRAKPGPVEQTGATVNGVPIEGAPVTGAKPQARALTR